LTIQRHWEQKTQDEDKQNTNKTHRNATQKTEKTSNTDLTKKPEVNPGAH